MVRVTKIEVQCAYCGNKIMVAPYQLKRAKNHYCNKEHSFADRKDRGDAIRRCGQALGA